MADGQDGARHDFYTLPSKLDVFISYNQADEEIARKIGTYLESKKIDKRNINVFFAPWNIRPASNFVNEIDDGLAKANFFVLVLSPDALEAEWPTAERAASLLSDPSGRMHKIIPVLAKSCKIPPLLAFRDWIDLRDRSKFETGMVKIFCAISGKPLPRGTNLRSNVVNESGVSTLLMENKASEPDILDEQLHTNLFPVTHLPLVIWSAPTTFRQKSDIFKKLKGNMPSFILRENRLYTFANLSKKDNKLRLVINKIGITSANIKEWLNDKNKSRWLVDLLGSEAAQFCRNMGLYFDKTGKQFYGDINKISNEKFSWTPHVREGKRRLIIPYTKRDRETGEEITYYYRHRAVGLRFQILGSELFLWIEPGWEFSTNGSILIKGKRRSILNTKLQSRRRNDVEFDEMRFWAWILSDGTKIKMGSGDVMIEIDSKPLLFKISCGVYGDNKPIPDITKVPPLLVEEDGTESIATDAELDEDVKEVSYYDV